LFADTKKTFTVGGRELDRRQLSELLEGTIKTTAESGQLPIMRRFVKAKATAAKHGINIMVNESLLKEAVVKISEGAGEPLAVLERAFAGGPGSGINQSRGAMTSLGELARTFASGAKKHWKYPALGIAAAAAASWALAPRDLKIPSAGADRRLASNEAGNHPSSSIPAPDSWIPSIQSGGLSPSMQSFEANVTGDYGIQGVRRLSALASSLGSNIRFSDNRGAITPEYIRKIEEERYD
jgi:hypothetical protein